MVLLEESIGLISDLCKEAYNIDKAFPDLRLLDQEEFLKVASEEILGNASTEDVEIEERLGRHVIVGANKGDHKDFYLLDQQGQKVVSKNIVIVGEPRNNSRIISMTSGLLGLDFKEFLFNGYTGRLSGGFIKIKPTIGSLWLARISVHREDAQAILDNNGVVLYEDVDDLVPNSQATRALIRIRKGHMLDYNVLLGDGELLFDGEAELQSAYNSLVGGGRGSDERIVRGPVFRNNGQDAHLNADLEIIEAKKLPPQELEEAA